MEVTEAPSAELCPVRRLRIECWSLPVHSLHGCSRARRRLRMALLTLCSGLRKSALLELLLQVALASICSMLHSPLYFRERDWAKGLNESWHSCFQGPVPNRKLLFVQMLKSCGGRSEVVSPCQRREHQYTVRACTGNPITFIRGLIRIIILIRCSFKLLLSFPILLLAGRPLTIECFLSCRLLYFLIALTELLLSFICRTPFLILAYHVLV